MPNEAFHQCGLRHDITLADLERVQRSERHLWLIGYVDYFDKFGGRHRSGYARKCIPVMLPGRPNNLVFTTESSYN